MSEYSMPVLSEQERKDLIGLATIEVKRWEIADGKQYMVELMNIALAALTAEPVIYEAEVNGVMSSVTKSHFDTCEKYGVKTRKLYTAPPVPVIKQEGEQRD